MHRSPLGTPGMLHGLRPTSPGDARSVGSFQAVKWLSRHILARKRAAVFHGPLTAFHLRIPIRWNHMIRFQCVGIGGAGGEASSEPYSALLFNQAVRRSSA